MPNSTQRFQKLFQIAEEQNGFFTTKQAVRVGYRANCHAYHVGTGNWVREQRGIYRLANYPAADRPDLTLWYLWSRNREEEPQGVYSHETSLALHELTDINPDKLHMTVPESFRRNSRIPEVLVLHYADLVPDDIDSAHGVKITNPMRTIKDIFNEGTLPETLIKQAVSEAVKQGLITKRALDQYRREAPGFQQLIDKMKI